MQLPTRRQTIINYLAAVFVGAMMEREQLSCYLENRALQPVKAILERQISVFAAANNNPLFAAQNTFLETESLNALRLGLQPLNFGIPEDQTERMLKAVMARSLILVNMAGMPEGEGNANFLKGFALKSVEVHYEIVRAMPYFAQVNSEDAFAVLVIELKITHETLEHRGVRLSQWQATKAHLS